VFTISILGAHTISPSCCGFSASPRFGGWFQEPSGSVPPLELVTLLLQAGATVSLPLSKSETLLHYVFEYADSLAIRAFLEYPNLDINIRDQKGRTAFIAACDSKVAWDFAWSNATYDQKEQERKRYIPSYILLASSEMYGDKIDYLATDNDGNNMLMHLLPKWNTKSERFFSITEMSKLVFQKNNAGFSPLHLALEKRQILVCLDFINHFGADVLEEDPNGDTAAHHMCRFDLVRNFAEGIPVFEKFLEAGGNINARNHAGLTPFLTMFSFDERYHRPNEGPTHSDYLDFFVWNGADVFAVGDDGLTVLHYVANRSYDCGQTELFHDLVKLGCDPLQEDISGKTALDVAAARGHESILELYQRKKE
jgi:ankyrin repeat protein